MLVVRGHAADVQIERESLGIDSGASLKGTKSPMSVKNRVIRNCRF